jgi:hypothetical protein
MGGPKRSGEFNQREFPPESLLEPHCVTFDGGICPPCGSADPKLALRVLRTRTDMGR